MDSHNPVVNGELPGRKAGHPQSGRKNWKVVKNWHTRRTVVSLFGKKYSSKIFHLRLDVLEKSNVLESNASVKQPAGCSPTLESPFSPQCCLVQEECNPKVPRVPCLEHLGSFLKKCSSCIDPLVLTQFLLVLISLQFLPEDSLDESIAGMGFFTVFVVVLTPRMEGAAATELVRLIIQTASKSQLLWLILLSGHLVTGSCAEPVQTSVASKEAPNTQETAYYIKTAAVTICLGCFTIAVAKKILTNLNTVPEPVVPTEFDIMDGLDRTDYRESNLALNIRPKI